MSLEHNKIVIKCEECGTTFKPKDILSDGKFTGLLEERVQLIWKTFCEKQQNQMTPAEDT